MKYGSQIIGYLNSAAQAQVRAYLMEDKPKARYQMIAEYKASFTHYKG